MRTPDRTQRFDFTLIPSRAKLDVMGLAPASMEDGGVVQRETYLALAGGFLSLMFAVVWLVTLIFNPGVIHDNPILANVGCNNSCGGLEPQPAESPG